MKSLYDTDFHEWSLQNAELLRSGRLAEADVEHIAEELEGLSASEPRELLNRLKRLLQHLAKGWLAGGAFTASWRRMVMEQRDRIDALFRCRRASDATSMMTSVMSGRGL